MRASRRLKEVIEMSVFVKFETPKELSDKAYNLAEMARDGGKIKKGTEATSLCEVVNLLTEFELVDNVLYILRESIEILNDVHLQTLRVNLVFQRLHREGTGVVEWITRHLSEKRSIINNVMAVAELLLLENGSLGGFKEHVDATQHHERQDNFLVVALLKSMHQHIVGDVPDEGEKSVILLVVHRILI